MQDEVTVAIPTSYGAILAETNRISFPMASDLKTGSMLKTLAASKPDAKLLELGTGTGLATAWILAGMNENARLLTVEQDDSLWAMAKSQLKDPRIDFVCADANEWIKKYNGHPFDLIFADAMPGKYDLFEETWSLLKVGGLYVVDDMLPQLNWPVGHALKVSSFTHALESRKDIALTKLNWSTGLILAAKVS